ncbi:hypothetical protein [Amycolatopsis sp. FDAARGOS 1241]|uniref:acyl-CoA-like ligand-binding transcription factor n=1 Tax=Amycolatopsis sp. FDAARGOS 1241 TaxID=2778070 RepID=UPI001EF2ECF9|nr:hypothetical protein [Amycolatopsis sp. FDAARGOS 1241]
MRRRHARRGARREDLRRQADRPARDSLYPLAVGRVVFAACRAAYEHWSARADADLAVYWDASLRAVASGCADPSLTAAPSPAAEWTGCTPRRNSLTRREPAHYHGRAATTWSKSSGADSAGRRFDPCLHVGLSLE